jgi:uncharacterized protein
MKDDTEAIKWNRKAAEQNIAGAQLNLGLCYAAGGGVPKDQVQAHAWLNVAGSSGKDDARIALAILKERMTEAEKNSATELAREIFERLEKKSK